MCIYVLHVGGEGIPEAQKHKKSIVPEKREEQFHFPNSLRQFSSNLYFPTKIVFLPTLQQENNKKGTKHKNNVRVNKTTVCEISDVFSAFWDAHKSIWCFTTTKTTLTITIK